jgi:flagellar protein FlbD
MIVLTRLNGSRFGINDEQIERLEEAPNTIVVLVTGNRYTVLETLDEIVERIVSFRADVLKTSNIPSPEGGTDCEKTHSALSIFHRPATPDHSEGITEIDEEGKPSPFPHDHAERED